MKNKTLSLFVVAFFVVAVSAFSYSQFAVGAGTPGGGSSNWTPPTQNFPGGNTQPPVDTSAGPQTKEGSFSSRGKLMSNGFEILDAGFIPALNMKANNYIKQDQNTLKLSLGSSQLSSLDSQGHILLTSYNGSIMLTASAGTVNMAYTKGLVLPNYSTAVLGTGVPQGTITYDNGKVYVFTGCPTGGCGNNQQQGTLNEKGNGFGLGFMKAFAQTVGSGWVQIGQIGQSAQQVWTSVANGISYNVAGKKVGIGVANPTSILQVVGDTPVDFSNVKGLIIPNKTRAQMGTTAPVGTLIYEDGQLYMYTGAGGQGTSFNNLLQQKLGLTIEEAKAQANQGWVAVGGGGGGGTGSSPWTTCSRGICHNGNVAIVGVGNYIANTASKLTLLNTTANTGREWYAHSEDNGAFQIYRKRTVNGQDVYPTMLEFPGDSNPSVAAYFLNGNVGFNNENPQANIHVSNSPVDCTGDKCWTTANWWKGVRIDSENALVFGAKNNASGVNRYGMGASAGNFYVWDTTSDNQTGNPRYLMTIANGHVGIGNANPEGVLSVGGTGSAYFGAGTNDFMYVGIRGNLNVTSQGGSDYKYTKTGQDYNSNMQLLRNQSLDSTENIARWAGMQNSRMSCDNDLGGLSCANVVTANQSDPDTRFDLNVMIYKLSGYNGECPLPPNGVTQCTYYPGWATYTKSTNAGGGIAARNLFLSASGQGYTLDTNGGTLAFKNNDNDVKFTIGYDGVLNYGKDTTFGGGGIFNNGFVKFTRSGAADYNVENQGGTLMFKNGQWNAMLTIGQDGYMTVQNSIAFPNESSKLRFVGSGGYSPFIKGGGNLVQIGGTMEGVDNAIVQIGPSVNGMRVNGNLTVTGSINGNTGSATQTECNLDTFGSNITDKTCTAGQHSFCALGKVNYENSNHLSFLNNSCNVYREPDGSWTIKAHRGNMSGGGGQSGAEGTKTFCTAICLN